MSTFVAVIELLYSARYLVGLLVAANFIWQQWVSYRRLSQFKGPFWASLTNFWMVNSVLNRRQHLDLFDVSNEYGSFTDFSLTVIFNIA